MNKQEIEKAIDGFKRMRIGMFNATIDGELFRPYLDTAITCMEQQLTNGWIPVDNGKNLPDTAGTYIATVKFEDNSIGTFPVWYHAGIRTDILWEKDNMTVNVIAWQRLPESYKEVSNE